MPSTPVSGLTVPDGCVPVPAGYCYAVGHPHVDVTDRGHDICGELAWPVPLAHLVGRRAGAVLDGLPALGFDQWEPWQIEMVRAVAGRLTAYADAAEHYLDHPGRLIAQASAGA